MASWEEEVVLSDNGVAGLLVKSPPLICLCEPPYWESFLEKTHLCCLLADAFVGPDFLDTRHSIRESQRGFPPSQLPWHHQLNNPIERTYSAFRFDFFASRLNFHLPVLTWVTPNTTACVMGPQSGVACCVHKLIAIRIVILTRSSWDQVSLIPSFAARIISVSYVQAH